MLHTSKLILGTVQLGLSYGINNNTGVPGQDEVCNILDLAYQNNIRTLDTAEAYGNSEEKIAAFQQNKKKYFNIISKFKYKDGIDLVEQVKHKLTRLKVRSLHTYMFHSFDDYIKYPQLKSELIKLKETGLIKLIGLSIYTNQELSVAIEDKILDVIQLPYNLLDNYSQRGDLLKKARECGKEIHSRSVFLQGLFFKSLQSLPEQLIPLRADLYKLQEIAKASNLSIDELALQYALNNENIDKVLFGVETTQQMQANLKAAGSSFPSGVREEVDKILVKDVSLLNPVNW